MEKIGKQKIKSYFDAEPAIRPAANATIRRGKGHPVDSYFQLAKKIAELQFLNREFVFLFRGQKSDHRSKKGSSLLKARLFRLNSNKVPTPKVLSNRFSKLKKAEEGLLVRYGKAGLEGHEALKRYRILRWAILQHYEVCDTPLLDVTHSLRIATSFASYKNDGNEAFLFVFGVPNLSGAITASSEAGLQVIRLSNACPPDAVRPHLQEGYLLGEYPEIADFEQNSRYKYYEMDFGRRLVAKFRFNPGPFWKSKNFKKAPDEALYPSERRDPLLPVTDCLKTWLSTQEF